MKQSVVDTKSLERTINEIFNDGEPEEINRELSELIKDPKCIVPFIYSIKTKKVAEFLPKVMNLPADEGVFELDLERLFKASTEKKDLVYQALTLPNGEQINK